MVQKILRIALVAGAAWASWGLVSAVRAENYMLGGPVEPYANYYAYGNPTAQMYPCPLPTPPLVGRTYITYPPLAPQEYLYHHERIYSAWRPDSGWTQTKIAYGGSAMGQDLRHFFIGKSSLPCRSPMRPPLGNTLLSPRPN